MQLKDLKIGDTVYFIEFYKDTIFNYSILEVRKIEFLNSFYGSWIHSSYVEFNSIIGEDDIFVTGGNTELDQWINGSVVFFKHLFTTNEDTFVQIMKLYAT